MLINFTVANWMSFRDTTDFSMIASKEKQHGERLGILRKYKMRVLPATVIYGGNASGKTNFFKAISFARQFILQGSQAEDRVLVEPFLLENVYEGKPSQFAFTILIENHIYEFSFSLTTAGVVEEKLIKINSSGEKTIYHRKAGDNNAHFHSSVQRQRLQFALEGTRDNQLFLTNSVSQKIDTFRDIYNWFKDILVLASPDTRFGAFEYFPGEDDPLYDEMNRILPSLDTGISRLGGETISLDMVPLPEKLKQTLKKNIKNNQTVKVQNEDEWFIVSRRDDKLTVKKLYTCHLDSQGREMRFEIKQESDGSKRIIAILPALLDLMDTTVPKVYIIDEIGRSLHPLLTGQLLEEFLSSCDASTRKQLLFTTHDLTLMDQSLFRRDEIWVTQRRKNGSSELISFSEYDNIRYDKVIRKSYLLGQMGGVPHIVTEQLGSIEKTEEEQPS